MPLQKQNLYVLETPPLEELSFDDLFGPPELRPGELHEPYPGPVSEAFRELMAERGVPISLATTVLVEYEMVSSALASTGVVEELGARARREGVNVTRPLLANYIRTLFALCNGQRLDVHPDAAVVVSSRLADRIRACGVMPGLQAEDVVFALLWELAAAAAGQTMTEWALTQALDMSR